VLFLTPNVQTQGQQTSFSLDLNAMKTPPPIPLILTLWKADDPLNLLSFDFDAKKRDWPSSASVSLGFDTNGEEGLVFTTTSSSRKITQVI
jgi:hypothetical protein